MTRRKARVVRSKRRLRKRPHQSGQVVLQQHIVATKSSPIKKTFRALRSAWGWITADVPARGLGSVLFAAALLSLCLAVSNHTLRHNPGGIFLYLFIVLWAAFQWGFLHAIFATALSIAAEAVWTGLTWSDALLDTPNDLRIAVFAFIALGISALLTGVRRQQRTLRNDYETQRALAVVFQRALLPQAASPPGYDIAFAYEPASRDPKVGGDFLDVFPLGEGHYEILLGDVTGHGVNASVHTAEIRYGLRALSFGGLSPSVCIGRINDILIASPLRERYATAFLGIIDTTSHCLTYTNAGHEAGLVWRAAGGPLEKLQNTGIMLGVTQGAAASYEALQVEIGPGDGLVLYSDGVTEARRQGEMFGGERLESFILQHKSLPAASAVETLLAAIKTYTSGDLQDDLAILWIRREPTSSVG